MEPREQNRKGIIRILLAAGGVTAALFAIFLGVRIAINAAFAGALEQGTPEPSAEEGLLILNAPEGYVPHYNMGNAYYKREQYDEAIDQYQRALQYHPADGRECDIRVNLALAMLHKIDFDDLGTDKKIDKAIQQLRAARLVLTEEGCAADEGPDGHDPEAQKLREEIDRMIEELQQQKENQDSEDQEQEEQQQQQQQQQDQKDKQKSAREREIEEKMKRQKQQSMQEQEEAQKQKEYREREDDGGYGNYEGKNW